MVTRLCLSSMQQVTADGWGWGVVNDIMVSLVKLAVEYYNDMYACWCFVACIAATLVIHHKSSDKLKQDIAENLGNFL